jgi:hypothetical protein
MKERGQPTIDRIRRHSSSPFSGPAAVRWSNGGASFAIGGPSGHFAFVFWTAPGEAGFQSSRRQSSMSSSSSTSRRIFVAQMGTITLRLRDVTGFKGCRDLAQELARVRFRRDSAGAAVQPPTPCGEERSPIACHAARATSRKREWFPWPESIHWTCPHAQALTRQRILPSCSIQPARRRNQPAGETKPCRRRESAR